MSIRHPDPTRPRVIERRWFAPYILGLTLVTAIFVGVQEVRQVESANCQARYNRASAEIQDARAKISQEDRDAFAAVIKTLLASGKSPLDIATALKGYEQRLQTDNLERDAVPLPKNRCPA